MSAYLCDARHLSAIVNAVGRYSKYLNVERYLTVASTRTVINGLNTPAEALFSDLLQTNLDSLGTRYPEHANISEWTDAEGEYRYESSPTFRTGVEALKGIACYEYQSCEHDGWKTSKTQEFCEALRSEVIASLPGWEKAAWGYQEVA